MNFTSSRRPNLSFSEFSLITFSTKFNKSSTTFFYNRKYLIDLDFYLLESSVSKLQTLNSSFSFYNLDSSLQMSDDMAMHIVERSVDVYSIRRKNIYSRLREKGGKFYGFFLSNLTNVISDFSESLFFGTRSLKIIESQFFLNLVSGKVSNFVSFWFLSYLSRIKKYQFLKSFYFSFYLDKRLLFPRILKTKFKRFIYLKTFLSKFDYINQRNVFFLCIGNFFLKKTFLLTLPRTLYKSYKWKSKLLYRLNFSNFKIKKFKFKKFKFSRLKRRSLRSFLIKKRKFLLRGRKLKNSKLFVKFFRANYRVISRKFVKRLTSKPFSLTYLNFSYVNDIFYGSLFKSNPVKLLQTPRVINNSKQCNLPSSIDFALSFKNLNIISFSLNHNFFVKNFLFFSNFSESFNNLKFLDDSGKKYIDEADVDFFDEKIDKLNLLTSEIPANNINFFSNSRCFFVSDLVEDASLRPNFESFLHNRYSVFAHKRFLEVQKFLAIKKKQMHIVNKYKRIRLMLDDTFVFEREKFEDTLTEREEYIEALREKKRKKALGDTAEFKSISYKHPDFIFGFIRNRNPFNLFASDKAIADLNISNYRMRFRWFRKRKAFSTKFKKFSNTAKDRFRIFLDSHNFLSAPIIGKKFQVKSLTFKRDNYIEDAYFAANLTPRRSLLDQNLFWFWRKSSLFLKAYKLSFILYGKLLKITKTLVAGNCNLNFSDKFFNLHFISKKTNCFSMFSKYFSWFTHLNYFVLQTKRVFTINIEKMIIPLFFNFANIIKIFKPIILPPSTKLLPINIKNVENVFSTFNINFYLNRLMMVVNGGNTFLSGFFSKTNTNSLSIFGISFRQALIVLFQNIVKKFAFLNFDKLFFKDRELVFWPLKLFSLNIIVRNYFNKINLFPLEDVNFSDFELTSDNSKFEDLKAYYSEKLQGLIGKYMYSNHLYRDTNKEKNLNGFNPFSLYFSDFYKNNKTQLLEHLVYKFLKRWRTCFSPLLFYKNSRTFILERSLFGKYRKKKIFYRKLNKIIKNIKPYRKFIRKQKIIRYFLSLKRRIKVQDLKIFRELSQIIRLRIKKRHSFRFTPAKRKLYRFFYLLNNNRNNRAFSTIQNYNMLRPVVFKLSKVRSYLSNYIFSKFTELFEEIGVLLHYRIFRRLRRRLRQQPDKKEHYVTTYSSQNLKYPANVFSPLRLTRRLWKMFRAFNNNFLVKIYVGKRNFFINFSKERGPTLFSTSGGKGGFKGRTQVSQRSALFAGRRLLSFFKRRNLGSRGKSSEKVKQRLYYIKKYRSLIFSSRKILKSEIIDYILKKRSKIWYHFFDTIQKNIIDDRLKRQFLFMLKYRRRFSRYSHIFDRLKEMLTVERSLKFYRIRPKSFILQDFMKRFYQNTAIKFTPFDWLNYVRSRYNFFSTSLEYKSKLRQFLKQKLLLFEKDFNLVNVDLSLCKTLEYRSCNFIPTKFEHFFNNLANLSENKSSLSHFNLLNQFELKRLSRQHLYSFQHRYRNFFKFVLYRFNRIKDLRKRYFTFLKFHEFLPTLNFNDVISDNFIFSSLLQKYYNFYRKYFVNNNFYYTSINNLLLIDSVTNDFSVSTVYFKRIYKRLLVVNNSSKLLFTKRFKLNKLRSLIVNLYDKFRVYFRKSYKSTIRKVFSRYHRRFFINLRFSKYLVVSRMLIQKLRFFSVFRFRKNNYSIKQHLLVGSVLKEKLLMSTAITNFKVDESLVFFNRLGLSDHGYDEFIKKKKLYQKRILILKL